MAECLIKIIKLCSNILPSRVHFRDLCFMDENPKLICSYSLFRALSRDSGARVVRDVYPDSWLTQGTRPAQMCNPNISWSTRHQRPGSRE